MISTSEENQQNQAALHPALNVFTKIFAGIMQQQQQQQPFTTPTTGSRKFSFSFEIFKIEFDFLQSNRRRKIFRLFFIY